MMTGAHCARLGQGKLLCSIDILLRYMTFSIHTLSILIEDAADEVAHAHRSEQQAPAHPFLLMGHQLPPQQGTVQPQATLFLE